MNQLLNQLAETLSTTIKREVIDPAVIDQGAVWVREFKKAFPVFAFFVNALINGTPEAALNSLIGARPDLAHLRGNRLAIATIAELQKKLRGNQQGI